MARMDLWVIISVPGFDRNSYIWYNLPPQSVVPFAHHCRGLC